MEVVDGWRAKLYPRIPTWREIYSRHNRHIHVGHSSLADSIRQVYVTGEFEAEKGINYSVFGYVYCPLK